MPRPSPPPHYDNPGEVIFFTAENQSAVEPIVVSCSLNGIVFDNEAIWNDQVSDQHSDYDSYNFLGTSNPNNALLGSTHELTTSRTMVAWESVYDGDYAASPSYCTGMVGWGVYTFSLGYGSAEPEIMFTLNTVDGRWMYQSGANHQTNKFIFRVTREVTSGISLEVYNWDLGFFVTLESFSTVTFWMNNVASNRFRDGLDSSPVQPFTLSINQEYPLGCDEAMIDVHLVCDAWLKIACGKKISIVDYFDEYTQEYESTIVRFATGKGIEVGFNNIPYLTTTLFIQGQGTANPKSVVLASKSYNGGVDTRYNLWYGIKAYRASDKYSSSDIYLYHCAVLNAVYGLKVERLEIDDQFHRLEIDGCIIRYCGNKCVETLNSNINLHHTDIDYSSLGVWYDGYSFNNNHPNRIEHCNIQDIDQFGIVIDRHARGYDVSMGRANILAIEGNFLQDCKYHGISAHKSLAMIHWNHFSRLGWTGASETYPAGYCGVWSNGCEMSFHENLIELCTAYGLQADNCSSIKGNYHNYNTEDGGYFSIGDSNPLIWGLNCFTENDFNVGTSNNTSDSRFRPTTIVLGQRPIIYDPLGLSYIGHGNTFRYPTRTAQGALKPYHMTAEQSSEIWAFRNYWLSLTYLPGDPDPEPINVTSNAQIHREDPLPDDVEDACGHFEIPPQNRNVYSSAQTYSDNAEMILTRTLLGLTDTAAMMAYNAIDNSMDSAEIRILMLALRAAYIFDYDVVARDTLRKYAFDPHDPGATVDYLTSTALAHLITAEILVDNWEGAIVAIDTVLARDVPPIVKAEYLAQKVAYYFKTTSDSSYLSTLDNLLTLYPDNKSILVEKFLITQDTSCLSQMAKAASPPNQSNAAPRPGVVSFPNPAQQYQTILAANAMDVRTVTLYDYLGRAVDASSYTYSLSDDGIHMTYNLPEGLYFMSIRFNDSILHTKVVVHRR